MSLCRAARGDESSCDAGQTVMEGSGGSGEEKGRRSMGVGCCTNRRLVSAYCTE